MARNLHSLYRAVRGDPRLSPMASMADKAPGSPVSGRAALPGRVGYPGLVRPLSGLLRRPTFTHSLPTFAHSFTHVLLRSATLTYMPRPGACKNHTGMGIASARIGATRLARSLHIQIRCHLLSFGGSTFGLAHGRLVWCSGHSYHSYYSCNPSYLKESKILCNHSK